MLAVGIPRKQCSLMSEGAELGQLKTPASTAERYRKVRYAFQPGKTSSLSLLCLQSTAKSLNSWIPSVRYVNEPLILEQPFTTCVLWGRGGEFISVSDKSCRRGFCFEGTWIYSWSAVLHWTYMLLDCWQDQEGSVLFRVTDFQKHPENIQSPICWSVMFPWAL